MKLRTTTYHVTHIIQKAQLTGPAHKGITRPWTRWDYFGAGLIIGVLYFIYGVIA